MQTQTYNKTLHSGVSESKAIFCSHRSKQYWFTGIKSDLGTFVISHQQTSASSESLCFCSFPDPKEIRLKCRFNLAQEERRWVFMLLSLLLSLFLGTFLIPGILDNSRFPLKCIWATGPRLRDVFTDFFSCHTVNVDLPWGKNNLECTSMSVLLWSTVT